MDPQKRRNLWDIALENFFSARLTLQQGYHNVSVACSYYAAYTAMYVALGEPTQNRWKHGGIVNAFAPGGWRNPPQPISRQLRLDLKRLYQRRVEADYDGIIISMTTAQEGIKISHEAMTLVAGELNFSQRGLVP